MPIDKADIEDMYTHINFEDSIFIINARIRVIRDMLLLDTDPELFLEQTLDDANFIDVTLTILLKQLSENKRFIERMEQFYNLSETERIFAEVLSDLISGDGDISAGNFPAIRSHLNLLLDQNQKRKKTLDDIIATETQKASTDSGITSNELAELLRI
ncbi:MAG: hypothetical protein LBH70_06460 [Spirochaetaceae bacterium]|jgi:hypothetical protein|nr:hypothetical protein [Spirochaetaceae bacterium]